MRCMCVLHAINSYAFSHQKVDMGSLRCTTIDCVLCTQRWNRYWRVSADLGELENDPLPCRVRGSNLGHLAQKDSQPPTNSSSTPPDLGVLPFYQTAKPSIHNGISQSANQSINQSTDERTDQGDSTHQSPHQPINVTPHTSHLPTK